MAGDNDGSTSIHYAAGNGHLELTQLLLDLGARGDMINHVRPDPSCALSLSLFTAPWH